MDKHLAGVWMNHLSYHNLTSTNPTGSQIGNHSLAEAWEKGHKMQLGENVNEGKQWSHPTTATSRLEATCAVKERPFGVEQRRRTETRQRYQFVANGHLFKGQEAAMRGMQHVIYVSISFPRQQLQQRGV
ncbi:uncharacterized protein AB9W97_019789 isoform 1-T1 [Spinachia spinachia]